MRIFITCIIILTLNTISAQKNVFLRLSPNVNGADLQLGSDFFDLQGNLTNLDYFNYYLSNLHLTFDGGQDLDLSDTVFLVKSTDFVLYLGNLNLNTIENISFSIGVPPNINTISGPDVIDISAYPMDHPLSFQDPSMHWGWSAGYIFLVSAGLADSNGDGITDALFEMHNLGDHNYVSTSLPIIQTNIGQDQIDINLNCNIDVWFKNIPLATVGVLHGTNGYNADMMANVITEAVFTQPLTAGTILETTTTGSFLFKDQKLVWNGMSNGCLIQVFDSNGKLITQRNNCQPNGEMELSQMNSGCFISKIISTEGIELNRLKFVR